MAYIDETYGKQLEEALRGLASRPALGQPWFGFHESEVPAGVLLFTATTHSRALYADFWNYIQNKNLVKTEEEWQSIYSAQGWCPYYSDGDGIDTFRMPSTPLYIHGANTNDAGGYIAEGLPNITGTFEGRGHTSANINYGGALQKPSSGAFSMTIQGGTDIGTGSAESNTKNVKNDKVTFDASKSNSIYGNSSHVIPETSKMLFGVWAIATPQQPIPDATAEGIMTELGEHSARFSNYLPLTGGTMTGTITSSSVATMKKENNTSSLRFVGGSDNGLGGELLLYGKNHEYDAGEFILRASLGDGVYKSLHGKPDGTLRWNSKNVECVNTKGNKYIRYENGLQLSWGTNNITTSGTSVSFGAAFKDSSVAVSAIHAGAIASVNVIISSITNTSCTFKHTYSSNVTVTWIAVGFWK